MGNLRCVFCESTKNTKNLPEGFIGEYMCSPCRKGIIKAYLEITETWKFYPNTGGLDGHKKAKSSMTNDDEAEQDEMTPYKPTTDGGMDNTQKLRKKYINKNTKLGGDVRTAISNYGS